VTPYHESGILRRMGSISEGPDGEGIALSGELVPASTATLARQSTLTREQRAEILEEFIGEKGIRSEHTAARYRRDLTVFFAWADSMGHDVFAMLPWQMSRYAKDMKDGKLGELKASTRAGRINAVSAFYRFLQQQHDHMGTMRNPAEHTPRPEVKRKSKTRKLTAEELTALRNEARRRGPQLYALVQLLVGSGVRISEALESDVNHLKREGAEWYLYVQRKGSEDREAVQVPIVAARALRHYWQGRKDGPMFLDRAGRRMSRRAAASKIQYAAIKAGIKDRNVSPHSLRHTATTLALDEGVSIRDVQVQMGHSSTETTARYDRDNRERNNPTVAALGRLIADDLTDDVL
jgi:site-specific recombinase XerD